MEGDDGPSAISNKPTVIKGNHYVDSFKFSVIYVYLNLSRLVTWKSIYFLFTIKKLRQYFCFLICSNHACSTQSHFVFNFFSSSSSAAQEEMGRLDVLVCGQCHSVFHFIEEFQEHRTKEGACSKASHFRETNDVCIIRFSFMRSL